MKLKIRIRNFRAVKDTQMNVGSGVNILIGPNGSGKTTLFLALKFLRNIILHGVGLAVAKEGGATRTYRRGTSKISFTVEYGLSPRIFDRKQVPFCFTWEIDIAQRGKEKLPTIIRERAALSAVKDGNETTVFEAVLRRNQKGANYSLHVAEPEHVGKDLFSYLNGITSAKNKAQALDHLKNGAGHILKNSKKNNDKSFFPQLARLDQQLSYLHSSFLNLNEYNILPDIARQSTDQLPFVELLPNGGNLSEVIHALENKNFRRITDSRVYLDSYFSPFYLTSYYEASPSYFYEPPGYRVRGRLRDLILREALENINTELAAAVKPIQEVSAQIDPTNGKRFVVFRAGKDTFFPEEVSDGTMKWLCILVSIYVPFSQVYLIEEPENFLHPWMQQKLIQLMRDQARNSGTIFLLTTHSTTILNSAKPEEVLIVKSTQNGTTATSMRDDQDVESFLAKSNFGLGDLWVSGKFGGVPGEHE